MTSFDSTDFFPTYTADTLSEAPSLQDLSLRDLSLQDLSLRDPSLQDLNRVLRVYLQQRINQLLDICFTEIDQAFLIWGVATLVIFSLAQFSTVGWTTQAVLDAALTGAAIATTSGLTWKLAVAEKLGWVIFLWAGLMSAGVVATAYGIFCGSSLILSNLCVLWLGLCTAGYSAMAIGMRSRCFTAASLVHALAVAGISYQYGGHFLQGWQFLGSGLVMASTLFFFSVVPWDMQASESDIPC